MQALVFFMGLLGLAIFIIVMNPFMAEMNNTTTGIIPNAAGVLDYEIALWNFFMIGVPAAILILMVKRFISGRDEGKQQRQPPFEI